MSSDGRHLFSAGEGGEVHQWTVHRDLLRANHAAGGAGLAPFLELLEGGEQGALYRDMEQFFYYAQLRDQGLRSKTKRRASDTIPLFLMPDVLRGLSFYPTEQEVDDLVNEVKFSRYAETGELVSGVDLATLVKLYINHRPVTGVGADSVEALWATLGGRGSGNMDFGVLLDQLRVSGVQRHCCLATSTRGSSSPPLHTATHAPL